MVGDLRSLCLLATLLLAGCDKGAAVDTGSGAAACDDSQDADGDGLGDCEEQTLGTDPDQADSDGDGFSDGAERDCVSDPLDAAESCYACGWPHADPGTLVSTGAEVGAVVANLRMVDQCAETVDLWDLSGAYTVVLLTASWCPACKEEAASLGPDVAMFSAAEGIPARAAIVLFESQSGGVPTGNESPAYADDISATDTPVLADTAGTAVSAFPYSGSPLPGLCLLSPSMEILACSAGEGNLPEMEELILNHAG